MTDVDPDVPQRERELEMRLSALGLAIMTETPPQAGGGDAMNHYHIAAAIPGGSTTCVGMGDTRENALLAVLTDAKSKGLKEE